MKPVLVLLTGLMLPFLSTAQTAAPVPATPPSFEVHAFPNPTPGPLVVQIDPLNATVGLILFDASNRAVLVMDNYRRLGTAPLDLKHLPAGQYRLRVQWNGQVREIEVERASEERIGAARPAETL